ncbi:hypothetical protein K488DRAFT_11719, partial [Vararia minispora EC-137]
LLARAADAYGRLSATTVPQSTHTHLQGAYTALERHTFRLERKLASSEAQVIELAQLIRQTNEERLFVFGRLCEVEEERDHYISAYRNLADSATFLYRIALSDIAEERAQIITHKKLLDNATVSHATLTRELQRTLDELASARRDNEEVVAKLKEAKADTLEIEKKFDVAAQEKRAEERKLQQTLAREKEAAQKFVSTMQMHKTAEDTLRNEVERLSSELVDVERYQEAYYKLSDKVSDLAARNALAEDEAERLSQFNAEILSHNNPAQRIMYLDRIRRELAETKQILLSVTRDKENALAQCELLIQELAMYKSVSIVPGSTTDRRPKTSITRVARIPLASQSLNGQSSAIPGKGSSYGTTSSSEPIFEGNEDMTLEELT